MFVLFAVAFIGQFLTGWSVSNHQNFERHEPMQSIGEYATSGHFVEALFENWESEFLQMGVYVMLTAVLFQKGSPDSKDPDNPDEPQEIEKGEKPWPVRKGGVWLWLYERSLAVSLLSLFALSFVLHAWGGMREYNEERQFFHEAPLSLGQFLRSAQFWFQSFQNWQSEFLSIGALIVLSIYLRQKNSSQSKPVEAPHSQTGG